MFFSASGLRRAGEASFSTTWEYLVAKNRERTLPYSFLSPQVKGLVKLGKISYRGDRSLPNNLLFPPFDCWGYRDFYSERADRICDNSTISLTNLPVSFTGQVFRIKMSSRYFCSVFSLKNYKFICGFFKSVVWGLSSLKKNIFFNVETTVSKINVLDHKQNHLGAASSCFMVALIG